VTRVVRQAILGAELDHDEDRYTALDGGDDAMPCWEPSYECNLYWGNTFFLKM